LSSRASGGNAKFDQATDCLGARRNVWLLAAPIVDCSEEALGHPHLVRLVRYVIHVHNVATLPTTAMDIETDRLHSDAVPKMLSVAAKLAEAAHSFLLEAEEAPACSLGARRRVGGRGRGEKTA
jgi:hypothetical protein